MANQGRHDIERNEQQQAGQSRTTTGGTSEWERERSPQATGPGGAHGGSTGREEFYRRAEGRSSTDYSRNYGGGGYGPQGASMYGRAWDSTTQPYGSYPRSASGRDAYPNTSGAQYGYGPQPNYGNREAPRGFGETSRGERSFERAYGDYGHPGADYRHAYGDMGFGQPGQGTTHVAPMRENVGAAEDRSLLGRIRHWRRGHQHARDVMTRNPRTAKPTDTLQHIAQLMIDEDTGIVPIVEESNRLVGVVTDRDIVCRLVARGIDLRTAKASDVMTDEVECVTEDHGLQDVLRLMSDHQIRRVPVVARGDRLVGIISMADIAREADLDEALQDTFEEISSEKSFWSRLR